MTDQLFLILSFIAFLVLGIWVKKSSRALKIREFAISDGKRAWFPIAAGISMTYVGGAATLNMSSIGYQYGWWGLIDPIAVAAGIGVVIILVNVYRKDKGVTIGELLSGVDRRLSIFIGTITTIVYALMVAAQFVALQKLLLPYFPGVNESLLTIVPPAAVFAYVFFGGFSSVTKTDILQYILILICLVLPIVIIGVSSSSNPGVSNRVFDFKTMPLNLAILFSLSVLFVPVSQDIVLRVKAASSQRSARLGLLVGGISYFVIVSSAIYIGILFARQGMELSDPETVLPKFFAEYFPLLGIASIIAVMSAIISTLDSFSLSAIVTLANDVIGQMKTKIDVDDRGHIKMSTTIVFITALIVAMYFNEILGLILTGLLIYVSILIPLALGRRLGNSNSQLLLGGLGITVFIVVIEALSIPLGPKAIIYPLIHTIYVLIAAWMNKMVHSAK